MKTRIINESGFKCLAAIFVYGLLTGTGCALDGIFVSQTTGNIYNINTTANGAPTLLYTGTEPNEYWNGAAFDPANGLVYMANIGTASDTDPAPNTPVAQQIYSFNPITKVLTEVGAVPFKTGSTNYDSFDGAAFYNGLYYTIPNGTNQLVAFNVTSGGVTEVSSQTLGGLGTLGGNAVTGLGLGDIDFVNGELYISTSLVTGNSTTESSTFYLYAYQDLSHLSAPVAGIDQIAETGNPGVGLTYDPNTGELDLYSDNGTNGEIQNVNLTTGALTGNVQITGLSSTTGDFTSVPEPRDYALCLLAILSVLVFAQRTLRLRLGAVNV